MSEAMFTLSMFHTLFAYHWHTTNRMLELAEMLNEAEYHADSIYGRSIHSLLFHILQTDQTWRKGLETGKQQTSMELKDFPNLESIRAGVAPEQQEWELLLQKLTDDEIIGNCNITDWRGETYSIPRWRILQHLVLHGMQHHTEIAQLLTAQGHSPGDIDLIFYAAR